MVDRNTAADARGLETRHFHCTSCPSECALTVEVAHMGPDGAKVVSVHGNRCRRGAQFAEQEIVRPMRILATTVAVHGGDERLLPVRTTQPIPRDLHMPAMEEMGRICVRAPIHMGDVIVENLLDTGVALVASMDVDAI